MIVVLTGQNSFLLQRELQKITNAFLKANDEFGLEQFDDDSDFEHIGEALQSLPFLASRKLILLRHPSSYRQFIEKVEMLLGDLPETTDVVIIEPKIDKRSSYYKFLKKNTDLHEYNELDESALMAWASSYVKAEGGTISFSDTKFLVNRVGLSQRSLANELEKLLLYDVHISRNTIELLIEPTSQSTVFELLDAAFMGNHKKTMELYENQRSQKVEPQQIIAMLGWQLHVISILKAAGLRSIDTVASDTKLNPFVLRKSVAITKKLTASKIRILVSDLLSIDAHLKRDNLDPDEALRAYLLKVVQ